MVIDFFIMFYKFFFCIVKFQSSERHSTFNKIKLYRKEKLQCSHRNYIRKKINERREKVKYGKIYHKKRIMQKYALPMKKFLKLSDNHDIAYFR